ncbi:MAG: CPBP family glutamic-type intramembrane protease [Candidatus Hydrothermarchaeales archaeon]
MLEDLRERIEEKKRLWLYLTLFVFVLFFYNGLLIIRIIKGSAIKYETTLIGMLSSRFRGNFLFLVFIGLILYLGKEKIASLGFNTNGIHRQLAIGAVLGLSFFFFKMWVFDICFVNKIQIPPFLAEISSSLMRAKAPYEVRHFMWIGGGFRVWLIILVLGGVIDEIRRVFFITRFEKLYGRRGIVAAVFLDFFFYGVGGAWQGGLMSAFKVGVGAVIFSLIYLRKRNITESIVAHSLGDAVALYWMFYLPHRILVFC